jgi:hypothetical protein
MSNTIVPAEGGKFTVTLEGQAPLTLSAEEVATKLGDAWKPLDDRNVTFKVNGVERTATVKELAASASKVEGADAKFRDAASAIKVQETLQKIQADPQSVTPADFDLVLQASGAPPAQRQEALRMLEQLQKGGGAVDEDQGGQQEAPKQIPMQYMPKEVQDAVAVAGQLTVAERERAALALRAQIENNVRETLTKDPALSIMITEEANGLPISWDKDGTLANTLFQEFMDKVKARVTERPTDAITPEVCTSIAQTIRRRYEVLLGKVRNEQASDGGNLQTALGRAVSLPTKLQRQEPVKRVSVNAENYSENFSARMNDIYQRALGAVKGVVR